MPDFEKGDKVTIASSHPWHGHSGVVAGEAPDTLRRHGLGLLVKLYGGPTVAASSSDLLRARNRPASELTATTAAQIMGYDGRLTATCRLVVPDLDLDVSVPLQWTARDGEHLIVPDISATIDAVQARDADKLRARVPNSLGPLAGERDTFDGHA